MLFYILKVVDEFSFGPYRCNPTSPLQEAQIEINFYRLMSTTSFWTILDVVHT